MNKKCKHCGVEPIGVRLFDLVRYCRAQLHEDGLITDTEYAWLAADADLAKGDGSPSPRRLEEYDEISKRLRDRERQLDEALQRIAILRNEIAVLKGYEELHGNS